MKNIIKAIGLFTLIGFSFFYTDKVVEVIREEDDIMIKLKEVEDLYYVEAIDASVYGNTIVPGLMGKKINIDKSYKAMRESGAFVKSLIEYDDISPDVSIRNNRDKFIIKGNNNKQMVSLVFILDSNKYLEQTEKILDSKGVVANYFVSYNYLVDNSTKIKEMKDREFYSYGDNGQYTPDNLLFSNNLLSRITKVEAIYCLSATMDDEVIGMCSDNDLYTIVPSVICTSSPYSTLKDNLSSGSIVLLSMNNTTVSELSLIIDYIKGKGLKIGGLSSLLSEELD